VSSCTPGPLYRAPVRTRRPADDSSLCLLLGKPVHKLSGGGDLSSAAQQPRSCCGGAHLQSPTLSSATCARAQGDCSLARSGERSTPHSRPGFYAGGQALRARGGAANEEEADELERAAGVLSSVAEEIRASEQVTPAPGAIGSKHPAAVQWVLGWRCDAAVGVAVGCRLRRCGCWGWLRSPRSWSQSCRS